MSTFREMDTLNIQFIWIFRHLQYHFGKRLKTKIQNNPLSLCAGTGMSAGKTKLCFWLCMWESNWKDFTGFSSLHSLIQSQKNQSRRLPSINYPHQSWKALDKIPHPQSNEGAARKPLKKLLPKEQVSWRTHEPSAAKPEKGPNWAVSGIETEPQQNLLSSGNMNGVC